MNTAINHQDHNVEPIGIWKCDVYEGDVIREGVGFIKSCWNIFADLRWKLLRIPSSHYWHGRIKNKLVTSFGGTNLITTVGKGLIMDRLFGLSAVAAVSRIGVGTSNTAAAVGNTALTGSVFKVFDATPIRTSLTVACITTFTTSEANIVWAEIGSDNASTLLNRIAPIGPFTKSSSVSIQVTLSISQA